MTAKKRSGRGDGCTNTRGRSDNNGEKAQGRKSSSPCRKGAWISVATHRLPPVLPMLLPLEDDSNFT